jgi:hypothetical protein
VDSANQVPDRISAVQRSPTRRAGLVGLQTKITATFVPDGSMFGNRLELARVLDFRLDSTI